MPARLKPSLVIAAFALVPLVFTLALSMQLYEVAALQKMAGYATGKTMFGEIQQYLENMRDSLIPLTIPLGVIGLTGGAAAYMVGNVMAQRILGGVIIGLTLALLGPQIVA